MISEKSLVEAGFKKEHPAACNVKPGTCGLYQLRVKRGTEVLYFINVWQWDFNGLIPEDSRERYRWSIDARLYTERDSFDLNLMYEPDQHDPESIKSWYLQVYQVLDCVPDPHNQP